jgi:hypothetical protein
MGNPHSLMALHKGRQKSRRIIQWNLNCLCGVDGQSAQTATEILKIVDAGRIWRYILRTYGGNIKQWCFHIFIYMGISMVFG